MHIRYLNTALFLLAGYLAFSIYAGTNGTIQNNEARQRLLAQKNHNDRLRQANDYLQQQVNGLASQERSIYAYESYIRREFGLIKQGEQFFRVYDCSNIIQERQDFSALRAEYVSEAKALDPNPFTSVQVDRAKREQLISELEAKAALLNPPAAAAANAAGSQAAGGQKPTAGGQATANQTTSNKATTNQATSAKTVPAAQPVRLTKRERDAAQKAAEALKKINDSGITPAAVKVVKVPVEKQEQVQSIFDLPSAGPGSVAALISGLPVKAEFDPTAEVNTRNSLRFVINQEAKPLVPQAPTGEKVALYSCPNNYVLTQDQHFFKHTPSTKDSSLNPKSKDYDPDAFFATEVR